MLLIAMMARAQDEPEFTHPELKWSTIETAHFYVHFHNGVENTGRLVAKIAEDIYAPITSMYGYEPDGKIHFVVKDYDDYSNGGAFYLDNKVEIWASALDFELRGTHNWLRNVITHEFTHMISLGAARKIIRHIPAFYLQTLGYESEKRPDVLLGYPNRIISYPIPFTTVPAWFAEGVAQYQLPELEYDRWDSHRDMLLRTAVVEGRMLTYSEMSSFESNSIGRERVYNQGYSLTTYIAEHYGAESLKNILQEMRRPWRFFFDGAVKKVTGKSGNALYHEWQNHLEDKYAEQLRDIRAHKVEGDLLEAEGTGNFFPRWSPDGTEVAYLTNNGKDYLGQLSLVSRSPTTKKVKPLKANVHYAFSWSPDGTKLVYSSKSSSNPHYSSLYDLYLLDLKTNKVERLTRAARVHSPNWSPDGKSIACVLNTDGTTNLALFDIEKRQLKILTHYKNQEQIYTPQWSPDGRRILYGYSLLRGRDLYLYDLATDQISPVFDDSPVNGDNSTDRRDAVFSPDGRTIYFSWDESGIFNIYRLDLETKQITQLTNVIGGAFMPSVNRNGEIVFSTFVAEGYKIAYLQNSQPLPREHTRYLAYASGGVKLASRAGGSTLATLDVSGIKHAAYDDSKIPNYQVKPYSGHYTSVAFLPRLTFDYGTTKVGGYFYSSEMLDKFSFIGGAAANRTKDYDAFLLVDYKNLGPIIFLEAYNQVLHTTVDNIGLRYSLAQIDLGVRKWFGNAHHSRLSFTYSRYNAKLTGTFDGIKASFGYTYYIGKAFSFEHRFGHHERAIDDVINPRSGREVRFRYAYELNDFIRSDPGEAFKPTKYGTYVEVYDSHNLHRFELDWTEHVGLPGRTGLTLYGRGGLLTPNVNSFFYFFAGGLPGVRGYPYYSMEGRYLAHGRVTYRFPLIRHADFSVLHLYLDKVYFGVSYDYGGAFVKSKGIRQNLHDSINLQLRTDLSSFYVFPTRLFFNAAYGLDKFKNRGLEYGQEWRFYFGLSFGYLDE
ncbi:MAG: DPP IV N-terminal domain-containing protein [candidate division KSB1 bacterium]|nr:DPP IV N-terminal domain-containing protein [candidate division KSB1 bacterium]